MTFRRGFHEEMSARIIKDKEERNQILKDNFRGACYFVDWNSYTRFGNLHLEDVGTIEDMEVITTSDSLCPYFLYSRYPNEFDWVRNADTIEYDETTNVIFAHNGRAVPCCGTEDLYYAPNMPLIEPPLDDNSSPCRRSGVIEFIRQRDLGKYNLPLGDVTPFVFLSMS